MVHIAGRFIPVMLRRPVIAPVVRMFRRRLMAGDAKTDRNGRNRANRNERDQQEHNQNLDAARHTAIMTSSRHYRSTPADS
jgi:hypothetical protein